MDSHSILPFSGMANRWAWLRAGPCKYGVLHAARTQLGQPRCEPHLTYSQTGLATAWHRQEMDLHVLREPVLHLASPLHNGIAGQSQETEVLANKVSNCPFSLSGPLVPGCCGNLGHLRMTDSVLQALFSQQCQRQISRRRETHLRKLTNRHGHCSHAGYICRWLFSLSIV